MILYPDTDPEGEAFGKWYDIAWRAMGELEMRITISDVLEKNATPEQKEAKIDIVDFIEKDILNAKEAPVAEDMPAAEDAPVMIDVPANADEASAIADTPSVIEETIIVEKPKPTNTQLIVDQQKEIRDARNMPPTEMLSRMGKENPAVFYVQDKFGTVTIDSS